MKKILVLIPAFNEAGNIGDVIADIQNELSGLEHEFDILVVDDGSTDTTSSVAAEKGAIVIRLPLNNGIGVALQTGFRFALEFDYHPLIRLDADGQHPAQFIGRILAPVLAGKSSLVIGSRFIDAPGYKASFLRRVGIRWFSFLIRLFFRKDITDPTSGFQAMSGELMALFSSQYASDYPEVEGIVFALKRGFEIEEVAIEMKERIGGRSSIDWLRSIYYALKVTVVVILALLKK
jgi:glycosyltransferase involved in cell wall biosynthesis